MTTASADATAASSRRFGMVRASQAPKRPARRPAKPLARLQFQLVSRPQPLIWSAIALPTKPVKKPTIGPKAKPKNVTSANAGRTDTFAVPGMMKLKKARTPYSAAPMAA
jgi:hypothetical protein